MPKKLKPLPKLDVPGVSTFVRHERGRYGISFMRNGRRKKILLDSTHYATAFRQALDMAEAFDARRFDPWAVDHSKTTLQDAIEEYLGAIRKLSASTVEQRRTVLNAFARRQSIHLAIGEVDLRICESCYEAPGLSQASKNTYFSILHTFLRWCARQGMIEQSPLENAKKPRVRKGVPAFFTPQQLDRLLLYVEGHLNEKRPYLVGRSSQVLCLPDMIRVAVSTGLRRGELLHMRWADVDLHTGVIHVRSYRDAPTGIRFEVKDRESRVVPINEGVRGVLLARQPQESESILVFPGHGGKPRDGRRLSRTFRKYVLQSGLPGNLHWHSLRHTFASWLASSGVPVVTIQRWMGHASVEQTMVYADLLPSALRWQPSALHEDLFRPSGDNMGTDDRPHSPDSER